MVSIAGVIQMLRDADPPLTYLGEDEDVSYGKFLEFEMGSWNGKIRIVPSEALNLPGRPGDRSFLYRGQTARYETCLPSVLRESLGDERRLPARLALERIRIAELELVLADHPFKAVADKQGFDVDYHGLAQHYGIPTSLLDLTSNIEIAAFFAVARWDQEQQRFLPMDAGTGILYRLDWSAFGPGYSKAFDPVGIGPGLRPARQHAWTFRPRLGSDFKDLPHLTSIEFDHDRSASEEVLARFGDGEWLYPPDCLAALVEKLRDLPCVTMKAIRYAAQQDGQSPEAVERTARLVEEHLGVEVLEGCELQPEVADIAIAREQAKTLEENIRRLRRGIRLVRTLRPAPT